jgi:predicted HNH restriction endonuclease
MERHSQSKVSDDLAIPLCRDCHDLLHRRLSDWLVTMKPDYEYSAAVRKKVERMGWKP